MNTVLSERLVTAHKNSSRAAHLLELARRLDDAANEAVLQRFSRESMQVLNGCYANAFKALEAENDAAVSLLHS